MGEGEGGSVKIDISLQIKIKSLFFSPDLLTFTEEILNGKLYFLSSGYKKNVKLLNILFKQ